MTFEVKVTSIHRRIQRFVSAAAVALLTVSYGCGGASQESAYSETITAEEFAQTDIYQQTPAATDTPAPDTPGADTPVAETSASDSGARKDSVAPEPPRRRVPTNRLGNLAELFNDSNHFQLMHAQRLGIDPITDIRSYYRTKRPLVRVATNEDFVVDRLTHSYPYLVPEADALLHDIGRNFRDSLKRRGAKDYRIVVTSLLRTPATVKKLRRVNGNATELSTHQYATTFDISYNHFDVVGGADDSSYADLKMVLAEVIRDLHRQGRCMVKYERKSPCFHITVVR